MRHLFRRVLLSSLLLFVISLQNVFSEPEETSHTLSQAVTSSTLHAFQFPEATPPQSNYDLLRVRIKKIIHDQAADPSRIGIFIKDCDHGITPFEWNSRIGFVPGATQKLIISAAALDLLGPRFTYKTNVKLRGHLSENTFYGDLIVQGVGDPTIGSQAGLNPPNPTAVFHDWANAIKKLGIQRITGSVVGDDTCFDNQLEGSSWPMQDRGAWHIAQVSSLSFCDNCVSLAFKGGKRTGKPTEYEIIPATKHVLFHNGILTGAKGERPSVGFRRQEEANLINAFGTIPPKEEYRARASIHNPSQYFVTVLHEALISDKIAVDGPPIIRQKQDASTNTTTESWPVVSHSSPPLPEIIRIANQYGQNLHADMLLKTLGKVQKDQGSFAGGAIALHEFLQKAEIENVDAILQDGSGLSSGNSISPGLLVELLVHMNNHPEAASFQNSLCQPGQYGLLQNRFSAAGDADPASLARIRALSGTVGKGNYALAGYASTSGGVKFAFVFMINDSRLDYAKACHLMDQMAFEITQSPIRKFK